jgi:glycosyltransferase involved in cell wall biosynthesis
MKIYYLSTTAFADTDITFLHHLTKDNDLTYGVLIPFNNKEFPESSLKDYCLKFGLKHQFFFLKHRRRNPRQLVKLFSVILSVIKARPDIIYINDYADIYLNLLFLLFIGKRHTVVGKHDVEIHSGMKSKLFNEIGINMLTLRFNNFLTFSERQRDILQRKIKNKNVFSIPLPLKDFGPKIIMADNYSGTRFLFFGNVVKYKGLDVLLKAIDNLSKRYDNFELTIAGRANDWEAEYGWLVTDRKVLNLQIRYITNEEIPYFFSKAHYLVLPYRDVTQSGPLMIAYNYDIPVIASNLDGFREFIVDGETGFFFDSEDENSLARVLELAILRNEAEYNLLVKNVANYKNEKYEASIIAQKYNNLFLEIFAQQKK